MANVFGLTSWEATEFKKPNSVNTNKDLFLRLENGDNTVRILTKPHEYLVHRFKLNESDPGYGERILSSSFHGSDPLMDLGSKPKRRWLVGVIDRRTQSYKVLDMSVSAFRGIQELVRDEEWGDPSQYDINIKVNPDAGASGYYTVVPRPKKPLSPADLEIKEQNVDLEDLKRRCQPPMPEEVQARLDAMRLKAKNGNGSKQQSSPKEDESDEDFPPVS